MFSLSVLLQVALITRLIFTLITKMFFPNVHYNSVFLVAQMHQTHIFGKQGSHLYAHFLCEALDKLFVFHHNHIVCMEIGFLHALIVDAFSVCIFENVYNHTDCKSKIRFHGLFLCEISDCPIYQLRIDIHCSCISDLHVHYQCA